jgi:Yip1-like protein
MEDAMTFGDRVVGAMKLDPNAYEDVERDPTAIGQAVGVIVLAAVAAGIGNIFWGGITGIVTAILFSLLGSVIGAAIIWLVGTKLFPEPTTKADFQETFRVLGFAAAPGIASVITIIPILGYLLMLLIMLWRIAALVIAVKAVFDYSTIGKAIIVVVVGWVIGLCLAMLILAPIGMGAWMMSR